MIFTQQLNRVDYTNTPDAIKKMVNHIKYIQEQLEFTLTNLDSSNIVEIDTGKTDIGDSTSGTSIGSFIKLTGEKGESLTFGKNQNGQFEFTVKGADGRQMLYLDNEGKLIITNNADLTIDGGEW